MLRSSKITMTEENLESTSRRKKILYVGLFTFQILVVFWPMMSVELILQQRMNMSFTVMGMIENLLVLILIVTNIFFIREFIKSKPLWYFFILLYAGSFILSTIIHVNQDIAKDPERFTQLNLIALSMVFIGLWYTFYVAVRDIFRIKHDNLYSLLGAANIFLLIGSLFAFVIAIIGCIFPGMVVPMEQGLMLDNHANTLSFYTLASVDLPFDDVNPFIRKILVIESIFSHLFVVIIIGRLLSK
jgi:hypothetical protein